MATQSFVKSLSFFLKKHNFWSKNREILQ
jgi:hypothetical protein